MLVRVSVGLAAEQLVAYPALTQPAETVAKTLKLAETVAKTLKLAETVAKTC